MRWCRPYSIGTVLVIALCAPAGVSADSINEKIDKERRTLEQLKDQIEEKRRQADEAGKKRESILQGIQTLTNGMCATGSPNRRSVANCARKIRKSRRLIRRSRG